MGEEAGQGCGAAGSMSGAKENILASIRDALGRGEMSGDQRAELERRVKAHKASQRPARARGKGQAVIERFIAEAEKVACTIAEVEGIADVPSAVASYLRQHNLPGNAVIAPDAWLGDIPWDNESLLNLRAGASNKDDEVAITPAFGAVAETGTLMMASGPNHPTSLNFTPENHLVVLRKSQVAASYEEVWANLRKSGKMPRSVNMITGPSRTGDISMKIYLGAHGPRRLHIVMVDD